MSNCGPLAGVPVAAKIQIPIFCRILTRVGYTTILTVAVRSGHYNPLLFCWLFAIKDWCRKVRFQQNAKSRFASTVVDGDLGPLPPSAAHLTVSLFLCRSTHEPSSGALEECRLSSQSPSRVRDRDKVVAGRNWREKFSPDKWSLICLSGKSMIFLKKRETEKIELVARPVRGWRRDIIAKDVRSLKVCQIFSPWHLKEGDVAISL